MSKLEFAALPIPGYYAEINRFADTWSTDRVTIRSNGRPHTARGKRLKHHWQGKHWQVPVYPIDGGPRQHRYVHQLVLETFVSPRPDGLWALHKDDDPNHNHLSNLYWGTPSRNSLDSVANFGHYQAQKIDCARGHLLDGSNLAPWTIDQRMCLSCNRAKGLARYRGRAHDEAYVQELADEVFSKLMGVSV